jgi:hypothetical protein
MFKLTITLLFKVREDNFNISSMKYQYWSVISEVAVCNSSYEILLVISLHITVEECDTEMFTVADVGI